MERNAKIQENLFGESLLILGVSENFVYRHNLAVPRTSTSAQAEKAKTCKDKLVKGIRQFSPVLSIEGVSIPVVCNMVADVDLSDKDCPTVYQKRSRVLC